MDKREDKAETNKWKPLFLGDSGWSERLFSRLFQYNEIETDRLAFKSLVIMGLFCIFVSLLDRFGISYLGNSQAAWMLFSTGVVNIVSYFIGRRYHFTAPRLKHLVLCNVLLTGCVQFFFYPQSVAFLSYGPMIISVLYFNRRFTQWISVVDWVCYSLMLWGNVLGEMYSPVMREIHATAEATIWRNWNEVLVYRYLPQTAYFILTALVCCGIAGRGRDLVKKQSEIAAGFLALEGELKTASEMQLSSLPEPVYTSREGEISLEAFIRPAKTVSGDFYDYFQAGNTLVFLAADVSDKGLPAALFMMKARTTICSAILSTEDLEKGLETANRALCIENKDCMFLTMWIGAVNIHTGVGKYVNCGHLFPFYIRPDGTIRRIQNDPDVMLGAFEDAVLRAHPLILEVGSRLVLITDGMTDGGNRAGVPFGEDRIEETLSEIPDGDSGVCAHLVEAVDAYTRGIVQFDDMTAMCVRMNRADAPEYHEFRYPAVQESVAKLIADVNEISFIRKAPADVRRSIDVALDEVLVNIVDYGYPDGEGSFRVEVKVGENYADFVIADPGTPFNPLDVEDPLFADEPTIGGLGIYLAKNLMDSLEYSRTDGENRLHIARIWAV